MIYRIFIFFAFLYVVSAHAQQSNKEKVQAQVNETIKKLDWGGLDRYSQINNKSKVLDNKPDAVFMGNSITEGWVYDFTRFFF